jgi:hypothetical protein
VTKARLQTVFQRVTIAPVAATAPEGDKGHAQEAFFSGFTPALTRADTPPARPPGIAGARAQAAQGGFWLTHMAKANRVRTL